MHLLRVELQFSQNDKDEFIQHRSVSVFESCSEI